MVKISKSNFSLKQLQFLRNSTARINIASGSVRSGKTIASIFRWIHYIIYGPKGNLLMVGKTERTLKRNVLDIMEKIIGKSFKYNKGSGELHIGNRLIYIAGANDERAEEKIRGMTLAGAYGDEITIWPETFFKMLLSRLSVRDAKLFGSTNCDSPYHWLKVNYIDNQELNLKNFEFNIDDNKFLPKEYVENLKKEYSGLYYKRFIDALWVLADGTIYDMFDEKIHVIKPKEALTSKNYIVGIDYGISNPTVFLLFTYKNNTNIQLIKEFYYDSKKENKQLTDEQLAQKFEMFIENINPQNIYLDPSATSFKLALKKKNSNWNFSRKTKNEVSDGISFVSTLLSKKHLHITNDCRNTIKEFSTYCWDHKAQRLGEDKPLKINDHTMDALRYALYSHFGKNDNYKDLNISMSKMFG